MSTKPWLFEPKNCVNPEIRIGVLVKYLAAAVVTRSPSEKYWELRAWSTAESAYLFFRFKSEADALAAYEELTTLMAYKEQQS